MQCSERIRTLLAALDIPEAMLEARGLEPCEEAAELVVAEIGDDGREHQLTPAAAQAWSAMKAAASADGVHIRLVSAFRSIDRQVEIVRRKLGEGQSLDAILTASAPPGFSEHHSGCAIDIGTEDSPPLEIEFERTPAFAWLTANAGRFGFELSFPRGNAQGYQYEPWHWRHRA